jgi:hypothetical protein
MSWMPASSRGALVAALQSGGIEFACCLERVVIGPEHAMGATIAFD